jgi:dihydroorotate dehydrogenase
MIPVALAVRRGGADGIAAINTIRAITDPDFDTDHPTSQFLNTGTIIRPVRPVGPVRSHYLGLTFPLVHIY